MAELFLNAFVFISDTISEFISTPLLIFSQFRLAGGAIVTMYGVAVYSER